MLQTVEVRTIGGTLLSLPLEDVTNGLYIESIEGLDPVKATIVSSSFAQIDGSQYQSSRREERNIKITIGLDPDYTVDTPSVEVLRNRLYDFFMPKSEVKLRFITDTELQVDVVGRVESLETPLFSADPSVAISILCNDPDMIDVTPVPISGNTTSTTTEVTIPYAGTVETGIEFTLNVDRTLTAFTLYHRGPDGVTRTFDFSANLVNGDVVKITTIRGKKSVTLTRGGTVSSLLYAKSPQSYWIELFKGNNYFRAYATGAAIPWTISYTTRYGGL